MKHFNKIPKNFIYQIVENDLASGKHSVICTRFSPEPNGYLHIGHAKSICLNFGIAKYYGGYCNLRFDDTNPIQEHTKYIEAIKEDIKWLGFEWHGVIHYSSDYVEKLYLYAIELIKKDLAYVDELSKEQLRDYRGTLQNPGKDSPYRFRSIEENLSLFDKMKHGEFPEGAACLRAKIDMASPYIIMRDPVLYRIKFLQHHKIGTKWCIYPTYDFTHCISDAIEGITHSLCTLEFQDNRRLYDWILQNISINVYPRQYKFSRLNLEYTVMSKRYLQLLVNKNIVDGWDDPRMPTISGFRRKGYTASSICEFCHRIGLTKQNNKIEISALESCIRKELNDLAPRVMAVMNPIKIILYNLPKDYEERILVPNHPYKSAMGMRTVIFTREIMIEKSDFQEQNNSHKHFKKLILGQEVRLRHAYIIKADYFKKNEKDGIVIYCTCDLETLNKHPKDGRKICGVIHWVSCMYAVESEFRLYNNLFTVSNPLNSNEDFLNLINPDSLVVHHGFVESKKIISKINVPYQFERIGYFCTDRRYFQLSYPIFNRIVSLRKPDIKKYRLC